MSALGSRLLGKPDQSVRAIRIRTQFLLTLLLVGANVIAASIVLLIALFVVPSPTPNGSMALALFIAVPVYVGVSVLAAATYGTARVLKSVEWLTSGREPTPAERRSTLRIPIRLTVLQAALWAGATLLFVGLELWLQPERALSTALTIPVAGAVASGFGFLLTEFAVRPISARALLGEPTTRRPRLAGVGSRQVIFWALGTGAPLLGLMLSSILALTGATDTSVTRIAVVSLVTGGAALVFGLFLTILNARSIVAPVLGVSAAMQSIEQGDLDARVVVYDGTELGLLQSGFNQMAKGLAERERIQDLFGRHVGVEVARAATAEEAIELGGESREVTVLFVDLVGSTTFAATHPPGEVVAMLNRFFGIVVDEVDARQGLVNKFIGDAVLAVFGAPRRIDDHAGAGLAAARAIAARIGAEVPEVGAGIGVATGDAVAGNVGHQYRFEYTVTGDAVNTAARLTELAKDTEAGILVAWDSVRAAGPDEAGHWSPQGRTVLRGRSTATPLGVLRTVRA